MLFEKQFQEGYDTQDEDYLSWLKMHHPESVKTSSNESSILAALRCPSTGPSSISILVIHKAKSEGKNSKVTTTRARLITGDHVIEDTKGEKEQK